MNQLEHIGIEKLEKFINSARERCSEQNEDRMKYERQNILTDLNSAITVIKAFKENEKEKYT